MKFYADGSACPSQLRECEAVRLFADRASAVAGVEVTERDAPAVARLCQQLDGIPLAIELAAGRVGVLSVEEIVTRLDDRFRMLIGRYRSTAARHQTLRATIDWSYDLLPAAERDLLCRVSVFTGGWTLEASESVCAGDGIECVDILENLSGLIDKSLVVAERGVDGQARYRLLESVRQYAQERLRAIGDELSLILPLAALAFTVGALGEATRASMLLEESVALASKTGSRGRLALVSVYLGQVRYAESDMPRAAASARSQRSSHAA